MKLSAFKNADNIYHRSNCYGQTAMEIIYSFFSKLLFFVLKTKGNIHLWRRMLMFHNLHILCCTFMWIAHSRYKNVYNHVRCQRVSIWKIDNTLPPFTSAKAFFKLPSKVCLCNFNSTFLVFYWNGDIGNFEKTYQNIYKSGGQNTYKTPFP